MKITRAGLDLAKRVFQMHGVDDLGRALQPRRRTIPPSSRMRESIAKAESSDTPRLLEQHGRIARSAAIPDHDDRQSRSTSGFGIG